MPLSFFNFCPVTRSKKVFVGLAVLFAIFLAWASYDISRRTTFPGSKPQLKERLKKKLFDTDSIPDSTKSNSSSKSAA
jgi:hypothetical protein